jgi:uncharacterized membrane protein (UPF0127 family)
MRGRLLPRGLALAAAAAAGCAREPAPPPPPRVPLAVVPLGAPSVPDAARTARVEVAATPEAREKGLMFRDDLPEDTGMLFAYPDDRPLAFWMKNCRNPLSAAFMDREGLVLNVEEMAPGAGLPEADLPRYASKGSARYVLEMEGGWFARWGIRPGDRVDLSAALRGVEAR